MATDQRFIWILFIPSLLQLINSSQAMEAVMCYDCTSWNPYCASSVQNPFPEAVAIVECNITKTCFVRKERDGMISRGCADWWMFSSVASDYLGCQEQVPLWMKPQEWCFCDTNYCNGKSIDDIKQLHGQAPDLHHQDTKSLDAASKEEDSSDTEEKNKVMEQFAHPSTTILPWWWWHVHWSTEKPYWQEEESKEQENPSHHNNHHQDTDEQVISSKDGHQENMPEATEKWRVNGKVTRPSHWWDVPAVPTGPVGIQGDRPEDTDQFDTQQNLKDEENGNVDIEHNDHLEKDFFCWDCYSDNPLCGETVNTPVTYYVSKTACPITQKCFIRKDKGVIYRGCADGWKDSTIDYLYAGCKTQKMWDRDVEWCFCSSPYCNDQSMESLRNQHPFIDNTANKQGQGTHNNMDDK